MSGWCSTTELQEQKGHQGRVERPPMRRVMALHSPVLPVRLPITNDPPERICERNRRATSEIRTHYLRLTMAALILMSLGSSETRAFNWSRKEAEAFAGFEPAVIHYQ